MTPLRQLATNLSRSSLTSLFPRTMSLPALARANVYRPQQWHETCIKNSSSGSKTGELATNFEKCANVDACEAVSESEKFESKQSKWAENSPKQAEKTGCSTAVKGDRPKEVFEADPNNICGGKRKEIFGKVVNESIFNKRTPTVELSQPMGTGSTLKMDVMVFGIALVLFMTFLVYNDKEGTAKSEESVHIGD